MTNHPNRTSATFYAARLRAERAAGRKIIEMIEADEDVSADALWDVALASPREGDLLGLLMLSGFAHSRKAHAASVLRARALIL